MLEFAGIDIPISNREQYQLLRGRLPVRLGSPVDEGTARTAWINYSTPLWRRAGRSEAWIQENISNEWASAKDDIIRRYFAGDFGDVPTRPPDIYQEPFKEVIPPTPTPSPTPDYSAAKGAWIAYSTPLWQRAGRSAGWIASNIESEWASSAADIYRRWQAGDFDVVPPAPRPSLPSPLPLPETPIMVREVICPQCKSTLNIIPPSPETMVTQAFTWLTCPVCGYPELVQVPTGGFRVDIVSKQPWPPVAELPLVHKPLVAVPIELIRVDEGAARDAWINYSTPLWRRAGRSEAWIQDNVSNEWASAKDDIIRRYLAGDFGVVAELPPEIVRSPITSILDVMKFITTPPPTPKPLIPSIIEEITPTAPDWFIKQTNDALDQYEEKIIELEEALRTAQVAEFYNNPYGTIEAHAQTLLNQFSRYQPTVRWPLELSTRWSELSSRLQKLIIDARTAAKERKPIPTYREATQEQQSQWITDTISQLQQQGLPWSDVRASYPQPGQIAINGKARLPAEQGIPPTWTTFTDIPVGIPDYSVEERIQSPAGQEFWELAEVVAPAPVKKITPYLILAGLGVTTLGVWYYKKKKKRAR